MALILCTLILIAGLQLRIINRKETSQSFVYSWAPISQARCSFDWTPLSKLEVTNQHIRCHQLQVGENVTLALNYLLANLNSCAGMVALLLININNTYDIEASLPPRSEVSPFPILIVTSETGKAINSILDAGEVEAKIELPAIHAEQEKATKEVESFVEIGMFSCSELASYHIYSRHS